MATSSIRSQAASILAELQNHCLLMNFSFHRWTGQPVVRDATVSIPPTTLSPPKIAPPRWQLVPPDLKRAVDRIQSRTRAELDRGSAPFLFRGVHLVPETVAGNLFDRLVTLRADLDTTVEELVVAGYKKLLDDIEGRLGSDAFKAAEPYIPDAATMASRFAIEWWLFTLAPHASRKRAGKGVVRVEEAEEQFAQKVIDAADELVRRLHGELAAAARNLADHLESGGPIRKGTLDQVRRAYAKLRAFAFLADDELLAIIDRLDHRIGKMTPRQLKQADESSKGEVVALLRRCAAVASKETAIRDVLERLASVPS